VAQLGRLGIAQSTWGRACQQFGRERAALSVLLIDRNAELPPGHRYRVAHQRAVWRAWCGGRLGRVNLAGLFRATERNAQEAPQQAPAPEQLIEPQAGPLAI
jgi:hypothetical protein